MHSFISKNKGADFCQRQAKILMRTGKAPDANDTHCTIYSQEIMVKTPDEYDKKAR